MQNNAQRCRETYKYFKELGICVSCHCEEAMIGSVRCSKCADKLAKKDKARYETIKSSLKNYNILIQKTWENKKRLRQQRREVGICYVCGKHPAQENHSRCYLCLIKRRRKKDNRYNNDIPRNARPSYGQCYVCGQPVYKYHKVCYEHYAQLSMARDTYMRVVN